MKSPLHQSITAATLFACLAAGFFAHGADNSFLNTSNDFKWFTAANWQLGVPDETSTVYLNSSGRTSAGAPLLISSPTETAKAQMLGVAWGNGETGWIDIQSDFIASAASIIGRGIGSYGYGRISAGTSVFTNNLVMGFQAGSTGVLEVAGGRLLVALPAIHNDYFLKLGENGNGVLRLSGGEVRVTGNIAAGNNASASAIIDVSGGELLVGGGIGHWMGTPTLRVSDGFVSVANTLTLGSGANNNIPSQGYADISGGTIVVSNKLISGGSGCAEWVQTGGVVRAGSGGMAFGNGPLSVSTVRFGGEGSRLEASGEIYLSGAASAAGSLEQFGGVIGAAIFNMASRPGGTAEYFMDGGELVVSNIMRVGQSGAAEFTQTSGAVRIGGVGTPWAGTLTVSGTERDHFSAAASGRYRMTGGTLDTGAARLGYEGGDGVLELLGGVATIRGQTFIGNGASLPATGSLPGKGALVLGGNANATFADEASLGAQNAQGAPAASGRIHLLGGGSGALAMNHNLNVWADASLRVTLDENGVTPLNVANYVQIYTPVNIFADKLPGAQPGTYVVLTWGNLVDKNSLGDGMFVLDPSVDASLWRFKVDTAAKQLTVTLKVKGTSIIIK